MLILINLVKSTRSTLKRTHRWHTLFEETRRAPQSSPCGCRCSFPLALWEQFDSLWDDDPTVLNYYWIC